MATITGFLAYARIDDPSDPVAAQCLLAAMKQAERAGVPQDMISWDDQAALYIYGLAAQMYDNRGGGLDSSTYDRWLNSMRLQMVYGGAQTCENQTDSTPGG